MKLVKLIGDLDKAKKGARIPILDERGFPLYVIHRSVIDAFLAKMAVSGGQDLQQLTLKQLRSDGIGSRLGSSVAVVRKDATLADAKEAMKQRSYCQDVFVTLNGTDSEPMLGWITNVIVQDNARV